MKSGPVAAEPLMMKRTGEVTAPATMLITLRRSKRAASGKKMQTLDFATLIGAIVTLCGAIAYLYRRQETEHDTRREELKEAQRQVHILTGKLDESEDERERLSRRLAEAANHYGEDDE